MVHNVLIKYLLNRSLIQFERFYSFLTVWKSENVLDLDRVAMFTGFEMLSFYD